MRSFAGQPVRAFVVWEPVLPTDWFSPSTATLKRFSDDRATQFWDKHRLISRSMGERDKHSIVWDYIAVYPAEVIWENSPPPAIYHGNPVVQVAAEARAAITQLLSQRQQKISSVK